MISSGCWSASPRAKPQLLPPPCRRPERPPVCRRTSRRDSTSGGCAARSPRPARAPFSTAGEQQPRRHVPANIGVTELKEFEFHVGKVRVQATFVNHPGVCVGYRLFTSAGSIAYLPDNEPFQRMRSHPGGQQTSDRLEALNYASDQDQKIIEFLKDADVLIIDSQYDDAEYQ